MPDIRRIHFNETVSTSTFLKTYVREGDEPFVLCTADYQTAGRGQAGNSWESDRGCNLLFTLAHYAPPVTPVRQFVLSQAVALAIVDTLRRHIPTEAEHFSIKWPNDIYWHDCKIAGILIEHELTATSILRTLIGVGLNVNQPLFHSDAPNPVSMFQITGETYERELLLHDFLSAYIERVAIPSETLESTFHACLYHRHIPARFRDAEGEFEGIIEGTGPDGRLRIRKADATLHCYAFKEVSYII
jgi:BirA family biotin operon repressor/biotin-[acetyl-CoA-carboxylase] ligase